MFKVTQFEPRVLRWWWSQKSKIDFEPPYQRRGRLWSKSDKAFLIDSIINQYDIPKVYIADFTFGISSLNKKRLPYAIIDGKQRLEAIFDFFEGKLILDNNFQLEEDKNLSLGGLGYKDLQNMHPEVADIFDNFHLSVMRVIADDEEKINQLFVRLNRSKPLTGAELRNAMSGPVPELVRYITKHVFFKSYISFPNTRGQDLNAAAKLLLFEYNKKPTETKKKHLDQFSEKAKDSSEKLELASRRVIDMLDRMSEIFLPSDRILSSAGNIPVYYWLIRESEQEADRYIREFLIQFEKQRRRNRDLSKNKFKTGLDEELVLYDKLNRSTNDMKSHIERFRILKKRLSEFAQIIL
ncbi:MAG: DUF262 domain-containing protein [Bacillota bacterium]